MIVVKVGGSLYDHPGLGPGLWAYLETLAAPALLVPGGGPFADAVRSLDAVHGLGDESAHWLALRSLDTAAAFLQRLLGPVLSHPVTEPPPATGDHPWQHLLLEARSFCFHDAELPHSWDVTSDSIAAAAAVAFGEARLVLLKSADIPPKRPGPRPPPAAGSIRTSRRWWRSTTSTSRRSTSAAGSTSTFRRPRDPDDISGTPARVKGW